MNKAVNKISIPAISGLIIMALYNIVDTMFVAWIGTEATGATQIVMPIIMMSSAIGLALGIGSAAVISRLLGQKKLKEASQVSSTTFFLGLILGCFYILFNFLFLDRILEFFGATAAVYDLAEDYARFIIPGSLFMIGSMVLNNLLRSEGSAVLSMTGMAAGALLNIILDPLFIFAFGWGISGAALATSISQGFTLIILISAYLRKKSVCRLRPSYICFSRKYFSSIMTVGLPTLFKQMLLSLSLGLMNNGAVQYGGADLLAAVGILTRVSMLPTYVIFGLGQGLQPVIGYNQGAGQIRRVRRAFSYAMKVSGVSMILNALVFLTAGQLIMDIFKASPEVTALGVRGLNAYGAALFLYGFSNTITILFQALGKGTESMILSTARQGFILIPLLVFMGQRMGSDGILFAQTAADVLTFFLSVIMLINLFRSGELNTETDCPKSEILNAS
ncbi:MAG: MATE family efflux transporter [Spirochaetales bacterium]|nr:MATE family efflux transporter [Spirochaetales bacterium]